MFQYQEWNADKSLSNTVKRTAEMSKNMVLMQLKHIKDSLTGFQKSRVIVFDPRNGEIQVEVGVSRYEKI